MSSDGAQQARIGARVFFMTQAGGCADNACGVVRAARESEVASPSAPLSSQRNMPASGSLRSARRRHETHAMNALIVPGKRSERLYIRLTADEAEHVAQLADRRGLKVSDYVRKAVLRNSGRRAVNGRRVLPTDAASTIRELSAIARDLRRLVAHREANMTISPDQLQACIAAVHDAISGFTA
jgi:uncharacterized protein (DUF1778 family)